MSNPLARLRGHLDRRPDSEHRQAIARLAFALTALAATMLLAPGAVGTHDVQARVRLILLVETAIAVSILLHMLIYPGVSHPRRIGGMLNDYGALAALSLLAPELAPLYVLYLWITVDNGLRYGTPYLALAVAMALLSFLAVILGSDYWLRTPELAWGLLAGLAVVPAHLLTLLRALTRATEDARRANEAKSRFLANMSHDFRTPLNGIVGMTQLLATTRMSVEQRESVEVMQASAQSLLALVEDVLDISAIEAGKLRRADGDFRLGEVLRGVRLMLAPLASDKGLTFEMRVGADVPDALCGDIGHLRQILVNLISNAIKFTERGGVSIEVTRVNPAEEATPRLRFVVRDSGIGIPREAQRRIFQAFEQAEVGHARRFGGSGLGTTIAKSLTELMGGRIGFFSDTGAGSTFWVELPFRLAQEAATDEDPSGDRVVAFDDPFVQHRASVPAQRLLLADDQPANLTVLRRLLEKAGHRTRQVGSGDEVLRLLDVETFDAVIIDLHMPGISGLDTLRQARVIEGGGGRTPFIVLSADAAADTIRDCEQAGARAFLSKPVVAGRLLEVVAEIAADAQRAPQRDAAADDGLISRQVIDDLAELRLGDEFLELFIGECLRDAAACVVALEKAAEAGDWRAFRDQCHAIKGVAGNMGAVRLAAAASDAMRLDDAHLPAEWHVRLESLRHQLELACAALAEPARFATGTVDEASR